MGVGAVAGTKLLIAPPGAISVSTTWTEVKDVASLGDIMQAFNQITVESVGSGVSYDIKGTQNYPVFALTLNRNDTDPGQQALRAASGQRNILYNFQLQENDTDIVNTAVVTMTIATPGVITDAAHGLSIGNPVSFSTTGALPTGLTAGTTYYIAAAGFTTGSYSVAATAGGSAIATSGTQSGVHTRTTVPAATTTTWNGEVFGFGTSYGAVNNLKQVKTSISIRPVSVVYTQAVE